MAMRLRSVIVLLAVVVVAVGCGGERTAQYHFNRGEGYLIDGKYRKAIEDYTKALLRDPEYADAHMHRGFIYSRLGQHQMAIEDYTKFIQLGLPFNRAMPQDLLKWYPGLFSLENSLAIAYHGRSVSYRSLGQYAKADADLEQVCSFGQPTYRWAMGRRATYDLIWKRYPSCGAQ